MMMCSNVKISFRNIFHVHVMKAYGWSRGTPPFIISALDGGEWSFSCPQEAGWAS